MHDEKQRGAVACFIFSKRQLCPLVLFPATVMVDFETSEHGIPAECHTPEYHMGLNLIRELVRLVWYSSD